MKALIIVSLILGVLAIGSFVVVQALTGDVVEETKIVNPTNPICNGGCTAQNSCGNPTCGIKTTGSCGCGG